MTPKIAGKSFKWTVEALAALHKGSEAHVITILEKANLAAIHAGHVTLMPKDIDLAMKLSDMTENDKTTTSVMEVESEKDKNNKEASWLHAELFFVLVSMWLPQQHMVSIWTPPGIHMETMWCPGENHIVSTFETMCCPPGNHIVSTWKPNGVHLETTWCAHGNHIISTWQPCNVHRNYMGSMWKPCGVHMETMWFSHGNYVVSTFESMYCP